MENKVNHKCRACGSILQKEVIDLHKAPPSNAYVSEANLARGEVYLPLIVMVCGECWLVQTIDYLQSEELFTNDYAYLSSTSSSWLDHANKFTTSAIDEIGLNEHSFVVELAANDGYLLKYFCENNIPNLGIEPTASTAKIAKEKGIEIIQDFFCGTLANRIVSEYGKADLVIANNVYAHVPDVIDFTTGIADLLKSNGLVSIEVPHVLNLIEQTQFDTIYHEHYSYFSLTAINNIFNRCGMKLISVEKIKTHGGSLRVFGALSGANIPTHSSVEMLLSEEEDAGIQSYSYYEKLRLTAQTCKFELLDFLINARSKGQKTIAYGAAAKGNTLLNYSGIQSDLIEVVFDNSIEKQNKYMPGSNIPIKPLTSCNEYDIDNVLILPWNISNELVASFRDVYKKPVKFYKAIPRVEEL